VRDALDQGWSNAPRSALRSPRRRRRGLANSVFRRRTRDQHADATIGTAFRASGHRAGVDERRLGRSSTNSTVLDFGSAIWFGVHEGHT